MPEGEGTYGSKVGSPKKRTTESELPEQDIETLHKQQIRTKELEEGVTEEKEDRDYQKEYDDHMRHRRFGTTEYVPKTVDIKDTEGNVEETYEIPKYETDLKGTYIDEVVAPIVNEGRKFISSWRTSR